MTRRLSRTNTAKPDRIDSAMERLRSEEECVRLITVIGVGDREDELRAG